MKESEVVNERKYIAISITHSMRGLQSYPTEPKDYSYTLWGYKTTPDDSERCFAGYTGDVEKCEIYSLEDFQKAYGNGYIKCDEPVRMCANLCRGYKQFDTVLVDKRDYLDWLAVNKF